MFFLIAAPCQGGFYFGGTLGRSFSIIDNNTKKESDDGFVGNAFGGYGIVSGGYYIGGRIRFFGKEFSQPDGNGFLPTFTTLEGVGGLYITPSTLISMSVGTEIDWNGKWGVCLGASSRTMLTGVLFVQIEGHLLFFNKIDDNKYKRSMRFMFGGGYNF